MNSFQSLLESYSKLRKRTYKISVLSEGHQGARRSNLGKKEDGSKMSEEEFGNTNEVYRKLSDIGAFSFREEILRNITSWENNTSKDQNGDVWQTEKGLIGIKGAGSFTQSFNTADEPMIIKILQMKDKNGKHIYDNDDSDVANIDPAATHEVSPKQLQTSINNLGAANNIINIVENLFEGEYDFNFDRCKAAFTVPNPKSPFFKEKYMLHRAIGAFFTGEGRDFPEDGLLQASEDIKELTDFLKTHMGDLSKDKCIQPTDLAKVENMRNKFFFKNNYLSYGNFESSNMDSPKLVDAFTEIFEDKERVSRVRDSQKLKSDKTPVYPFLAAYEKAINDPSPALAITARRGGDARNPLMDIIDKFNSDSLGICGDEGAPIFRTDTSDTPTTLLSDISETSPQLNWLYYQIQKGEKEGKNMGVERKQLSESMNRIVDFALQKTEDMDAIIKLKLRLENASESDEAFMNAMYIKAEDTFIKSGSSAPEYTNRQNAAKAIAQILALDYVGDGVSPTLRQGNFAGKVDLVMEINGKPINKMVGVKKGTEGVANTEELDEDGNHVSVGQDTVVKADYALKCNTLADVHEVFRLFDIDKTSPDAKLTLKPHRDGNWYIEISDKLYNSSVFTSTGMLKMRHALNNNDIFDHHIDSVSHMGIKDKDKFSVTCNAVRKSYKATFKKSRGQLLGDDSKAKANPDDAIAERAALTERISGDEGLLVKYGPDTGPDGKMVLELELELKEFDKKNKGLSIDDVEGSKEMITHAEKICHLIARVELMDEQNNITDVKLKAQHRAAEAILYSVGSMSSGVCLGNVKHGGTGSERFSNQDQRRILAAAFNGDSQITLGRSGKAYSIIDALHETVSGHYGVRSRLDSITSTGKVDAKETRKTAARLREELGLSKLK